MEIIFWGGVNSKPGEGRNEKPGFSKKPGFLTNHEHPLVEPQERHL